MQGMNLIAGSLLFHSSESICFWLFCSLLSQGNLRELYIQDLPGHAKHSQLVEFLFFTQLRELYQHFCQNSVMVNLFISPWLFSGFAVMIPI
jgi:hypothetical protein